MAVWTCPRCKRRFGTEGRPHDCAPAMTEDEYFAGGPPHERPVYDVVRPTIDAIAKEYGGQLIVEFVSVGVFFKRRRNFCELRPMTKWVALSFVLPRQLDSARIARKARTGKTSSTTYHVVNVRSPDEIDGEVRGWLVEAYLAAAPKGSTP